MSVGCCDDEAKGRIEGLKIESSYTRLSPGFTSRAPGFFAPRDPLRAISGTVHMADAHGQLRHDASRHSTFSLRIQRLGTIRESQRHENPRSGQKKRRPWVTRESAANEFGFPKAVPSAGSGFGTSRWACCSGPAPLVHIQPHT